MHLIGYITWLTAMMVKLLNSVIKNSENPTVTSASVSHTHTPWTKEKQFIAKKSNKLN